MLAEFLNYIEEHSLINSDQRILLAVSGGMDSMVMTDLCIAAGIKFAAAHCNFCLRGTESDKDEIFVRKFMDSRKIPFFSKKFDTVTYSRKNHISIEMAARELRYKWFETIRAENAFSSVAVAHNLNDNIETILLNLVRGTGIAGLTGIKPRNGNIIRPLLFASRQKIRDYCIQGKIPYREDLSNADTKYHRNKIRNLVMPVLREINPSVETTLNETAKRLKGSYDIIEFYTDSLRNKISSAGQTDIVFDLNQLNELPENESLLFELMKPYGITASTTRDLNKVIKGRTGSQIFTSTHRILKNREQLIVMPITETRYTCYEITSADRFVDIPVFKSAELITVMQGFDARTGKDTAYFDSGKIIYPVIIRSWQHGDSFQPLGMKHFKKLSDYFTDRKYSLAEKEKALVMISGGKIAWLIGERIDDRFKITAESKQALRLELKG
ncbi:MAG: tRNA lysidine(34) synthetase TilS [Bacteroidales bacterium]|jgi:tRNA(Ile)-lysidine synthase